MFPGGGAYALSGQVKVKYPHNSDLVSDTREASDDSRPQLNAGIGGAVLSNESLMQRSDEGWWSVFPTLTTALQPSADDYPRRTPVKRFQVIVRAPDSWSERLGAGEPGRCRAVPRFGLWLWLARC